MDDRRPASEDVFLDELVEMAQGMVADLGHVFGQEPLDQSRLEAGLALWASRVARRALFNLVVPWEAGGFVGEGDRLMQDIALVVRRLAERYRAAVGDERRQFETVRADSR